MGQEKKRKEVVEEYLKGGISLRELSVKHGIAPATIHALIRDFEPSAANQLWVSDITYVRVGRKFAYLSLVTDAYSRKIVGYHLSRDLATLGCLKALRMALRNNPNRDGLTHHSDRGSQYSSAAYVKQLGPTRQKCQLFSGRHTTVSLERIENREWRMKEYSQ